MNRTGKRFFMETTKIPAQRTAGQTDERIMEIVAALKDDPRVRWKGSIREVIERCRA